MRAQIILRMRIQALLGNEHGRKKSLAQWCGHAPAWLTNVLNGNRLVGVDDLDKIADFFDITVPQLFEPSGEKLRFPDRRTNADRRQPTRNRRLGRERRKSLVADTTRRWGR